MSWLKKRDTGIALEYSKLPSGDPWYYIHCNLSYTVGSERNVTSII